MSGYQHDDYDDNYDDESCPNCDGEGIVPGCFEDTCVCGAEEDPHGCCSPRRCDWCRPLKKAPQP